jgi:hypothetical protein
MCQTADNIATVQEAIRCDSEEFMHFGESTKSPEHDIMMQTAYVTEEMRRDNCLFESLMDTRVWHEWATTQPAESKTLFESQVGDWKKWVATIPTA